MKSDLYRKTKAELVAGIEELMIHIEQQISIRESLENRLRAYGMDDADLDKAYAEGLDRAARARFSGRN